MTPARPYPPSAQRIAEARARGHVPRAPLVGVAAAVLALVAGLAALGPRIAASLHALATAPLEALATGGRSAAYRALEVPLRELGGMLAAWLVGASVLVLAAGWLAQGAAFGSPWRAHGRYPRVRGSYTASVLFGLGLALAAADAVAESLLGLAPSLVGIAGTFGRALAVLALACAVIDAAFARARFVASLWLSRSAHLDEQKSAFGAPLFRRARAAARRALSGAP